MRKIFSAVLVAAVLLASVAGCGGNSGDARDYMEQGDSLVTGMTESTGSFQDRLRSLFTGIFSGSPLDPDGFEKSAKALSAEAVAVAAQGDKARNYYQKIKGLSGVDEYRQYADLMAQALDLNKQGLIDMQKFLSGAIEQVKAPGFDAIALASSIESFSKQAADISSKLEKLQKQARLLKSKKGL